MKKSKLKLIEEFILNDERFDADDFEEYLETNQLKCEQNGLICESCGFQSNKENDWDIREDDIFCKKCGSYSVSPEHIENGVELE